VVITSFLPEVVVDDIHTLEECYICSRLDLPLCDLIQFKQSQPLTQGFLKKCFALYWNEICLVGSPGHISDVWVFISSTNKSFLLDFWNCFFH